MRLIPLVVVAALLLAGCVEDEPTSTPSPRGSPSSSTPTAEPSPWAEPSASDPATPTDLTPTPVSAPLAWEPAGRPVEEEVTAGGGWTVVVDQERSLATLSGPAGTRAVTVSGDKRFRVDQVLLDGRWAVIVLRDTLQQRSARATVVDLSTGQRTVLDGESDPPTVNGGTWALGSGLLLHATRGRDAAYCLAARSLDARGPEARGTTVYCADERQGFTNARITPAEVGLMSFDDQRPSCRTLGTVGDGELAPLAGVEKCTGWELVVTSTGPVWTVLPSENALDEAHVYAATADGGTVDLGPASSGSLTWCAGATYFVRDPQTPGEPARLLRWTDGGDFEVVYESTGSGQAFLEGPRCGGDRITVSSFAESVDEQVSASVG